MEKGTEKYVCNPFLSAGERMNSGEDDAKARGTTEAVARGGARARGPGGAGDPPGRRSSRHARGTWRRPRTRSRKPSLRRWQIGRATAVQRTRKRGY